MGASNIPFCSHTWELTSGCTPYNDPAQPCRSCWGARTEARIAACQHRTAEHVTPDGQWTSKVFTHPERLEEPAHWRKPRTVFVSSRSDLYHPDVPTDFVIAAVGWMRATPQHTYLLCTKRHRRMFNFMHPTYPRFLPDAVDNVWWGMTAWDTESWKRALYLLHEMPVAHTWISLEPILSDCDWDLLEKWPVGQVIVGCESGKERRLEACGKCWAERAAARTLGYSPPFCHCSGTGYAAIDWARGCRDACRKANIPLGIKQLPDARGRVVTDHVLDGACEWNIAWRVP